MSLNAQDYIDTAATLLPQGPVWDQFRESSVPLLSALCQEPARVAQDADLALEGQIPDSANTDLDHWEEIVGPPDTELSDAERLTRIRSLLFGRRKVDRSYLQEVVQAMVGEGAVVALFHRAFPPAAVGACNVGDSMAVGEWDYAWLCEYMANAHPDGFDSFNSWTGLTSYSADAARSPVTLELSADSATIPSAAAAYRVLAGTFANDATVRTSVWVRPTADATISLGLRQKDGSTIVSTAFACAGGAWHKLIYTGSIGTGSSAPAMTLRATGSPVVAALSYQVCGVIDAALEARIAALFPIHTKGHFAVVGEFDASLEHADQLQVML